MRRSTIKLIDAFLVTVVVYFNKNLDSVLLGTLVKN